MILDYDDIIKKCLKNDRNAQKSLYQAFAGKMYAVCLRYSNKREDAEDILQEGFVKIFNQLQTYRNDGSFEGWMRRIFVGLAIDYYRKNKKHNFQIIIDEELFDQPETEEENDLFSSIEAEAIHEAIQSLSDGYRTVFNLYAIEGFSHKEIANQLDISEGTSKSQFLRARLKLIEILKKKLNHTKAYGA